MMIGFKDILKEDVFDVFLDQSEFAEKRTIDGREMTVVFDDSELIERSKKQLDRADGIYKRQFILYVAASEFGAVPAVGRRLTVDGAIYRIVDVTVEGYVYAITLGVNRA